jgi:HlyD family secretion protein
MKPGNTFIFALILTCFACGKSEELTHPLVQDISESVYASGVIKAKMQYDVFSPATGIIIEFMVIEGDTVAKGDPLFVVDNTISSLSAENARLSMEQLREKAKPSSATLMELETRLQLAKEKLRNDSILWKRQENLWSQGVGSKLEWEQRELAFKAAKAELTALQLKYNEVKSELERMYLQASNTLTIAQKQQSDFIVKSRMNGTVYSIMREPGELVSGITPVAVVGATAEFEIELQVDEFDIVKIKPQQPVYLTMDSYRGKVFEASVSRIEPFMNPRTRTFTVWAEFSEVPPVLYPNLSLEANILIAKKKDALTIPTSYLIGADRVLSADGDTIAVKTGIKNLEWVEITAGLSKEQEVKLPAK